MTTFKGLAFTLLLIFLAPAYAVKPADISYMTEQYPPYNFEEDGQLKGIAVDVLEEMLRQMGEPLNRSNFALLPWAQGYKLVQEKPDTMLFSMTLTDEREPLFKWVGPVSDTRISLIARKADGIAIESLADLAAFRVGAIRDDIGEALLLQGGVDAANIDLSASIDAVVKKLERGRLQLWAYEENVAMHALRDAGLGGQYEAVYTLKEGELYYALHRETDAALVGRFQDALSAVKAAGDHDRILGSYR